jgi:hypothetical protein
MSNTDHYSRHESEAVEHPWTKPCTWGSLGVNSLQSISKEFPMHYLLALYADESRFAQMTPQQQQQGYAAYMVYSQALKDAGVMVGSNRLRPSTTATTVRTTDSKLQVLDGPFAESREQLGGYFLIDVPDLDAALQWAGRCPGSQHGVVEVRAIWDMQERNTASVETERAHSVA